jgi:dynein intermediate chain 1
VRSIIILYDIYNNLNFLFFIIHLDNFFDKVKGYILLYSLKNPRCYEYKIETDSGCMCLDFNTELPNLIAAGYYDGSVAVYDLSDKEIKLDKFRVSPKNIFKHLEPVWQVRWQKNDVDDNPNFSSISSDGFVLVWTIKNV